ncbi:MAG: hypothetical protein VX680_06425, partial [Candidatus Neomarinimicrobiota bacterium]|nr:hypothetical protein [Candidatus Neomarinimicrobiota bacterium]
LVDFVFHNQPKVVMVELEIVAGIASYKQYYKVVVLMSRNKKSRYWGVSRIWLYLVGVWLWYYNEYLKKKQT